MMTNDQEWAELDAGITVLVAASHIPGSTYHNRWLALACPPVPFQGLALMIGDIYIYIHHEGPCHDDLA